MATKTALEGLERVDPQRICLVQLSDFMRRGVRNLEERMATARTFRVFPGEGVHSEELARPVLALARVGWRGDYRCEVFNAGYRRLPLATGAERARRAAVWLAEDVLRRSTPLPTQVHGQVLVARG